MGLRVIKFEKNGCMPCKKMDAILNKLGVEVEHINIDEGDYEHLIEKYGITSTPTLVKIYDESLFGVLRGVNHTTQEFKDFFSDTYTEDTTSPVQTGCENGCCSL